MRRALRLTPCLRARRSEAARRRKTGSRELPSTTHPNRRVLSAGDVACLSRGRRRALRRTEKPDDDALSVYRRIWFDLHHTETLARSAERMERQRPSLARGGGD